ncbi:Txe/YoeB family addiction module toxin [Fusobacterium nucleatum]|uniref:Txe/YoeB family addiction module toxin n=1 Tax=Fusobacterium nucleatum TaxID=851 RepID=UPI0030CEF3D2
MKIIWNDKAWEEYVEWQTIDRKVVKKINELIKDIQKNENEGIGKPELLQHELSGYWSRRIDDKNRLVYKISDTQITIVACANNYK